MADEAFALSPISARAAQPNEEDYDAISAAFMETSRGRWFLGEYAKRNRNADTRMVLDAVARIEDNLAAQRQPPPESGLAEALASIRNAVDQARAAAAAAVESIVLEETVAPIRKGARIIREISWRWREIGTDGRICDLIDSQIGAIEAACGQISSTSQQAALSAAFDLIKARIAGLDDSDTASPPAAAEAPSPAPSPEMPAATTTAVQQRSPAHRAEAAMASPPRPVEAVVTMVEVVDATTEAVDVAVESAETAAEVPDVTVETAGESAEADDSYDEALLDLVALEMAAPDPADGDDPPDTNGHEHDVTKMAPADSVMSPPVEPIMVARPPEPIAASAARPTPEPSLGSTLIANGILRSRHGSESDPLAPIRRMSQIEKIAFFS